MSVQMFPKDYIVYNNWVTAYNCFCLLYAVDSLNIIFDVKWCDNLKIEFL